MSNIVTNGVITRITLHWDAGDYNTTYSDYHGCIKNNGVFIKTLDFAVRGAHTWMRNSGNLGFSFLGEENAYPEPDGHHGVRPDGSKFPILSVQIETMAKSVAEQCLLHRIPLHGLIILPKYKRMGAGTSQDRLVPTGEMIQVPTVTDHAWYAREDGYSDLRWDIADILPVVMTKAEWYLAGLVSGNILPEHTYVR